MKAFNMADIKDTKKLAGERKVSLCLML